MLSSSVVHLSRQLGKLAVGTSGISKLPSVVATAGATGTGTSPTTLYKIQAQSFATNRKVIDAKNTKRLKVQAKKKKNASKSSASTSSEAGADDDKNQPFLQHQEWVKFQQSISVDGFQTGQVTTAQVSKKSRGGKQARARREKELARLQQGQDTVSTKFPAIRYSPEETEELLKLAFATLPERAGKRGTRNLKRQNRRWKLVREIRRKHKAHVVEAHHRRMEKRQWKREQVKDVMDSAPETRAGDLEYQAQVLRRWASTMYPEANNHPQANREADKVTVGATE